MPRIDLRTVKTVFICPDNNEKYNKRRVHMETILAKHGFTNVIMYKSGTDYPHCLRHALYNILQQNLDTPVLILEDDIMFQKNPQLEFDIPDDADAFYIGVAGTSMDFEDTGRNRIIDIRDYTIYNDTILKVKNMLSTHAILYLGKPYKEKLSKLILNSNMPCDVDICKLQPLFNIYRLRFPICWQSTRFNSDKWPEHITKVCFNEMKCMTWNGAIEDDIYDS
jgi:hypothetical protein